MNENHSLDKRKYKNKIMAEKGRLVSINGDQVTAGEMKIIFPNLDVNPAHVGYLVSMKIVRGRKVQRTTLIDRDEFLNLCWFKDLKNDEFFQLLTKEGQDKLKNFRSRMKYRKAS